MLWAHVSGECMRSVQKLKDLETEIEEKKQHDEKLKKELNASLKQTLHALSVAKHKEFEEIKAQSKFHEAEIEKFRQERIKVTGHRFNLFFCILSI
jgi:hypothetical protein